MSEKALPRLQLGSLEIDQVSPVLLIDARIVKQISDRDALGLMGARVLRGRAMRLDYRLNKMTLVPMATRSDASTPADQRIRESSDALADLCRGATPVPFEVKGDEKIVVRAWVANPSGSKRSESLTLLLDTGATKTALFQEPLAERVARFESWPALRGLSAPTLFGSSEAWLARIPWIEVEAATAPGAHKPSPPPRVRTSHMDAALLDTPLQRALSNEVGETVHGLLGYSFLRRFDVLIDMSHRVLWLTPRPYAYDERPNEYSHVGLQLERRDGAVVAVGVATSSPAARAGIRSGDELLTIDGASASTLGVLEASRRLEGAPGTSVKLRVRRDGAERQVVLVRKRLL